MSSFSSGSMLLHFKILSKLGEGGMGAVYLAEDQKLGRKVALKVLPDASAASEKARRRLLQEARSASALNHPNLVTIHSIEKSDDVDFIVMEYIEGRTLSEILREGWLHFPRLLDFGIQIANGLAAAHKAGVIHRDIKTSNIFVTEDHKIKILDFGLAKITSLSPEDLTGDGALTEEGSILGTLYYMSPEQVRGEPLDSLSDLFSFGTLLYEAATGHLPFRGSTTTGVMYQILHATVTPPSTMQPNLPAEVDGIILRALAKEKSLRYQKAEQIADDLERLRIPRTEALEPFVAQAPVSSQENFVGREKELEKLQKNLQSMLQNSGSIVFLTGEPGIGKTALGERFLRTVLIHHPYILTGRGRCVENFGTGEAYLPFLDAVSALLQGPAKQTFIPILRQYAPSWCMQFPSAFTSTGVLEKSLQEAASASKERMMREVSDALIQISSSSPLILFLEDLHWADPSTADLIRYLSRRIKANRILILGTMRPEDLETGNPAMKSCRLDLQSHSLSEEIQMGVFSEAQVRDYLNLDYSPNSFPAEFASMLFRKTEGQPLFLSGLLQFLAGNGSIEKKNDTWMLIKSLSDTDLDVPDNVRSMIERKINALSEEDKRVLQFASVEGEEFHSIVLADLLHTDEIDLEEQLDRIQKKFRLIQSGEEENWPDGSIVTSYRFVHALYQNAFYSALVTKRRLQLHRLAGESILKHYGDRAPEIANKLGLHFMNGRDYPNAVGYLELAGDQAKTMYAGAEAEILYGYALSQLGELSKTDSESWKSITAKLLEKHADVLSLLGKQTKAIPEYERAVTCSEESDAVGRARLHRKMAKAAETKRDFNAAFDLYQKAEMILQPGLSVQSADWQREWLQIYLDRSWLYYTQNLQEQMQKESAIMQSYVQSIGTPAQRFHYYRNLILAAFRRERYRLSDETLRLIDQAIQAARESGVASTIADIHFVTGFANLWRGNLERSEEYLNLSLAESSKLDDAVLKSRCLTYLAVLYRKMGKEDLVRTYATQGLEHSRAINMQEYVAGALANQAWLALRANEYDEAKKLANEALGIWKSLPVASPFQSLAIWPLIVVQMMEQQTAEAYTSVELLLHPAQQPPDPEVESALRSGLSDANKGAFEVAARKLRAVLTVVEPVGYL